MRPWILTIAVLCASPLVSHSQPASQENVELVRRLYQLYAWEAAERPVRAQKAFVEEPRERLEEFLEPGLASLLRRDRECVERTREVCKLSFSPLWASQDPGATNLVVLPATQGGTVNVQFSHPGSGQQVVLRFSVVATQSGPRIADIEYTRGSTLRKLLGGGG